MRENKKFNAIIQKITVGLSCLSAICTILMFLDYYVM
mgnify:CR=1 FL=1